MRGWEDVLEDGGFDGLGVERAGVGDCFAGDELVRLKISHEVDDAFAVDANLLYIFVCAALRVGVFDEAVSFGERVGETHQCGLSRS